MSDGGAAPEPSRVLSTEELRGETGVSTERLQWLIRIGVLQPPRGGLFRVGDIFRVKMVEALLDAGYKEEHIEWAVSRGGVNLDHVDNYLFLEPGPRSGRDFAELSTALQRAGGVGLPAILKLFGIPEPAPASRLAQVEEELLEQFFMGWSVAGGEETFVRAARLVGEGTRHAAMGWIELLDEEVAGPARERFLRGEVESYPQEVIDAAALLIPLVPKLMVWLAQRYVEQKVVAGIVENFERILATGGLTRAPESDVRSTVVFADISGYTRLTEEHGDEVAVRAVGSLQTTAESVATENGGRLVKMLGDGAMMFFKDPESGVRAATELVGALSYDPGIPVHAGVHLGPVIERDRDLFGGTVNLAARIASTAVPREVVVSEAVVRSVENGAVRFERSGEATLKGVAETVMLFRVSGGQAQ
jgi:adenylate cyclase